jgi:exodeoxyribonuclease-5
MDDNLLKVDQIICAYNRTRVEVNKAVREKLGFTKNWPEVGDRLMCLRNNRKVGLFNGMQGTVEELFTKPKNKMIFRSDEGKEFEVLFDPKQFNQEKHEISFEKDAPHPFDFAYCITAHKAQGDEWGRVMVLEQKCQAWDHKRWAYTAASRAKESIVWVEGC